ncbi:hypothetical protein DEJ50_31925 [Streptomyces venezuelae]|uniref:Uncharacterized protein n=1 Tax=Streptomyces venezuelae TaxID=54571 RepID=A0A5P2DB63_STRVZ|nr:hypothetical protein [Streptomyces venezuelae]QES51780.1 hypothetical protein DEJ50_31925 [Streptomyces venezuelae]
MTSNAYSFLPWLRTGLTTRITAEQTAADTGPRPRIPVTLRLTGEVPGQPVRERPVTQPVQLYGPGDVVGVDPRAISRTEPQPSVTNAEPNFLAHIEFYEEDFPWQYSPAVPDEANRLCPWLALIVLAAAADPQDSAGGEFREGGPAEGPLPYITVTDVRTLPPVAQLGAWAHVHVNGDLAGTGGVRTEAMDGPLDTLGRLLRTSPDDACSRLICPRRLKPLTTYHAFLVPAFESGRRAGLGIAQDGVGATDPGWEPGRADTRLPYYHRWSFHTGTAGDFEYLVRLLDPAEADPGVGRRDIDVHEEAGPGLPPIDTPPSIGGVLKLGGALKAVRPHDDWDNWDSRFTPAEGHRPPTGRYPHPFQEAMAALVNLADDYPHRPPAEAHAALAAALGPAAAAAADPAEEVDPVITPPLYGRWPARTSRLLRAADGSRLPHDRNWVHRLNLDPRFRVAANFGTQVVQARQEEFMAAAWAQVGDLVDVNHRIRAAQLACEVGLRIQDRHLGPPPPPPGGGPGLRAVRATVRPAGRALALTAPAHPRVTVPLTRPAPGTGLAVAAAEDLTEQVTAGFKVAVSRIAAAPVSAAMRRITRPGSRLMRTLDFPEQHPPEALLPRMDTEPDLVTAAPGKTVPAAVVTPVQVDRIIRPQPLPDPVKSLPVSPGFVLRRPDGTAPVPPTPAADGAPVDPATPVEPGDSPQARRFKQGLTDLYEGWGTAAASARTPVPGPLDVQGTAGRVLGGLDAATTVPHALLSTVRLEAPALAPFAERFLEVMAYPVIDLPMYEALLGLSVESFVPHLDRIPVNTVTLLDTDQEFIEAFMVGLNHELARELLWREYPTDQRCTPFRQFWDPRAAASVPDEPTAARRERLYDIPPVHRWTPDSELGAHDHRQPDPARKRDELVLVIRGDLLKKYPNTAVYAHRARWNPSNENPDPRRERSPVTPRDPNRPTAQEIRLPIYEARVEPDITLLGFDLTEAEAKGNATDPGWFFVLQERPGEPRFGADDGPPVRVEVWNDLTWEDLDPGGRRGFIALDATTPVVLLQDLDDPAEDEEKTGQHGEDTELSSWHAGLDSADVAYMLFQAPVLMAVHAQEMLPRG